MEEFLYPTVRSDKAMQKLGLTTLGKKGKFLKVTNELARTCAMTLQINLIQDILVIQNMYVSLMWLQLKS